MPWIYDLKIDLALNENRETEEIIKVIAKLIPGVKVWKCEKRFISPRDMPVSVTALVDLDKALPK